MLPFTSRPLNMKMSMLLILCGSCSIVNTQENMYATLLVSELFDSAKYDKSVRPGVDQGLATNVTVDLTINAVTYIDELNMDYTLDMYFRSHWVDPRLAHNSTSSTLLGHQFHDVIWQPDLFFPNEKTGKSHDMVVPNQYQRLWPNGSLLMSKRISAKFSCYMDIRMYPVDNQTCSLQIESYGHTKKELDLSWTPGIPLHMSPDIRVTEFTITHTSHSMCDRSLPTGVFPCLRARLYFNRMSGVYLMNAYLPAVLVVIMSWVAFWLHVSAIAARVSIGLLTVLTMTTQTTSIISALPRVSYIKAIEVWMCGCLLFVFVAFLETATAFVADGLHRKVKVGVKDALDRASVNESVVVGINGGKQNAGFFGNPVVYGLDEVNNTSKGLRPRSSLCGDSLSSWGSRDFNLEVHSPTSEMRVMRTESNTPFCAIYGAKAIDRVSRVMFPVVFTLFNTGYWIVCYMF